MVLGQGKVLLFGEHAAVHGHPAVGMALDQGIRVDFSETDTPSFLPPEHRETLKNLIHFIAPGGERETRPLVLTSDLPIGAGFGSSGALCTALARLYHPTATNPQIWELANQSEKVFHGTPSGIDTGLSVWGGLRAFYPNAEELPHHQVVQTNSQFLVYGAVPRIGSTKSLVAELSNRLQKREARALRGIEELGELAKAFIQDANEISQGELGQRFDRAQMILADLGLSTQEMEETLRLGKDLGSLGGKLSGAGGGGAFLMAFDSLDQAQLGARNLARSARKTNLSLLMDPRVLEL